MGVTFGTYHSRTNFALDYIHKEIASPEAKVVSVDIPLRHGILDLTDRLTGGTPIFGNREITLGFEMRGFRSTWMTQWTRIALAIHGKVLKVVLDEDPNYYWEGRVNVNGLEDHGASAGLTITVDAFPFKWSTSLTTVGTYTLSGSQTETFTITNPVALPEFTVANNVQITYNNEIFVATSAIKNPAGLYLKTGSSQSITLDGSGSCTFAYRGGVL